MKLMLFIITYFLLQTLQAQSVDTLVLNKWDNGKAREIKIINNDKSFQIRKYYQSSQTHCEINYNFNGKLHGSEKCWFDNGRLKSESYWKDGINTGKTTIWYPSGQKSFEGKYLDNGAPDGDWKAWFENGQIQYEQFFSNGMKYGKWIYYRKDGGVGTFEYYENGILIKEEKF